MAVEVSEPYIMVAFLAEAREFVLSTCAPCFMLTMLGAEHTPPTNILEPCPDQTENVIANLVSHSWAGM